MEGSARHPQLLLQPAGAGLVHPAGQDHPRRERDRQPAGRGGDRLPLLPRQPFPVRGGQVGGGGGELLLTS